MADVVVVGAGPVGLLLAGELRLGGADVVVLEALLSPTTESRASTLHARTMEIFDNRVLLERIGRPPNDVRGHFGGMPIDLTLPSPFPGQWKVLQSQTEQVLQDWALELGADIRRGHEVRRIDVFDDHVEVDGLSASFVVGCDGENSTVRRLTAAEFTGVAASRELIRADLTGVTVAERRFLRLEKGFATSGRLPDGRVRVMVHEFGATPKGVPPTFGELVDTWRRVTGEDISSATPLWVNGFDDATGQVTRYREGRVLFAGDAAHRQPPIGGQALNLGLQDAVNLGWKLAAVASGRVPLALLDTYHDERHAIGRRTLGNIAAQAQLLFGGNEIEPLRSAMRELVALPAVVAALAGMISGLDVRYDLGPSAGHRLADVGSLLCNGSGALLTSDAELRRQAAPWSSLVTVAPASGGTLVRPDGHVAWVADGGTPLTESLVRWFGNPTTTCEGS